MKISNSHFRRIVVSIVLLLAIYGIHWWIFGTSPRESPNSKEGFSTEPIKWLDSENKKLPFGYYQVDANTMAQIPYGYSIDPSNPKNVIPKAQAQTISSTPIKIKYTSDGYLPTGYYKVSDVSMALIPLSPPGLQQSISAITWNPFNTESNVPMRRITNTTGTLQVGSSVTIDNKYPAKISAINTNGTTTIYDIAYTNTNGLGKVIYTYDNGYVSGDAYYAKQYDWSSDNGLPPKMYYVDKEHSKVAFLPEGTDASNCSTCYGYIRNSNLLLNPADKSGKQLKQYKDMSNNLDITFHPSAEDIRQQTGDELGMATVIDQYGNKVILPKLKAQGDVTYYTPGAYRFGPANYVPKYEDSVYLSRTTQLPTTAEYKSAFLKTGVCEATKHSPIKKEHACNALDVNTCSSMSCCVLLGGSKCVAGSEIGPLDKTNYSDLSIRNKNYYYFNGSCYGNCP
jgi:hypothetical protein